MIKERKKSYKLLQHETFAIALALSGIILIVFSCLPYGWAIWTGILQGVGTGLITGVVILLVAGVKAKELRELQSEYNEMRELIDATLTVIRTYSDWSNLLYEKQNSEYTKEELRQYYEFYEKYTSAFADVDNICFDYIDDCSEQIKKVQEHLDNIWEIMSSVKSCDFHESKENLSKNIAGVNSIFMHLAEPYWDKEVDLRLRIDKLNKSLI